MFGNLNWQNLLCMKNFLLSLFSSISKSFGYFICIALCPEIPSQVHSVWLVAHSSSHQGKPPLFPAQAAFVVNIAVLWHHAYTHKVCTASKVCTHPCHLASRMSSEKKFMVGTGSSAQEIQDSLAHFPGYYSLYDVGSLRTLAAFSSSPRNTCGSLQPRNSAVFIPM